MFLKEGMWIFRPQHFMLWNKNRSLFILIIHSCHWKERPTVDRINTVICNMMCLQGGVHVRLLTIGCGIMLTRVHFHWCSITLNIDIATGWQMKQCPLLTIVSDRFRSPLIAPVIITLLVLGLPRVIDLQATVKLLSASCQQLNVCPHNTEAVSGYVVTV